MKEVGYYNGTFGPLEKMQIPMLDRACYFGDGVYDFSLAYNGKIFALDEHVDRIYRSASMIEIEIPYTKEEMKVVNETKKILHLPQDLPISCTAARVPVYNGHSEAVDIEFENEITPDEVREILKNSFGVKVIDNPEKMEYPTTRDASGVDPVFVGRIRKNLAFKNGISLWCVADNLRIGAALNTVRICQKVIEMELY